ncbi:MULTISPECIES: glycoside hydrolase family protein [Streptomyces]|uniref:Lipoprotein n=1 Tax=Streptomyces albus (strain ATCC 21838 / DSM 41398 / FERM P-419 / JCM 4703 / NBRC 107858) TaxID=1081613 RepID=A0A0B5F1L3_STRA4|nr:glycoside hydrolase family protein [Streptomyces sp. SCSIO ZS0520]AJE84766.1 lipoprotein [Streptomyces albus]AOU79072.1 lipoprotein [Streptomyces albus]AYN34805.1 RNA polymerase [Streptomyces albus]
MTVPSWRNRRARRRPRWLLPLFAAALAVLCATGATAPVPDASPAAGPTAAGGKGVSVTPVDGAGAALADVGASWYYDWSPSTGEIARPEGAEFVPMIWGAGAVNDADLARAKEEGQQLLGFNEPDMAGQADMPVEQALDLWPRLQDTGLRLGAPAVAFGGDTPGGWLDRFMTGAAERGLRVDFIPLHWYGGDFGPAAVDQLRGYLQAVYDRYHKPVWLTEYALTDFSGPTPRYPSEQEQTDFARGSAEMLGQLPFVERYAWFTLSTGTAPTGLYDGTTPNATGLAYREAG